MLILLGHQQLHDLYRDGGSGEPFVGGVIHQTNCLGSQSRSGVSRITSLPPITLAIADVHHEVVVEVVEPPVALWEVYWCCSST